MIGVATRPNRAWNGFLERRRWQDKPLVGVVFILYIEDICASTRVNCWMKMCYNHSLQAGFCCYNHRKFSGHSRSPLSFDGSITLVLSYNHLIETDQKVNFSSHFWSGEEGHSHGGSSSSPVFSVTTVATSRFSAYMSSRGYGKNFYFISPTTVGKTNTFSDLSCMNCELRQGLEVTELKWELRLFVKKKYFHIISALRLPLMPPWKAPSYSRLPVTYRHNQPAMPRWPKTNNWNRKICF